MIGTTSKTQGMNAGSAQVHGKHEDARGKAGDRGEDSEVDRTALAVVGAGDAARLGPQLLIHPLRQPAHNDISVPAPKLIHQRKYIRNKHMELSQYRVTGYGVIYLFTDGCQGVGIDVRVGVGVLAHCGGVGGAVPVLSHVLLLLPRHLLLA